MSGWLFHVCLAAPGGATPSDTDASRAHKNLAPSAGNQTFEYHGSRVLVDRSKSALALLPAMGKLPASVVGMHILRFPPFFAARVPVAARNLPCCVACRRNA